MSRVSRIDLPLSSVSNTRQPPRMLLHLPRQRIKIPRPLMPRKRLPPRQAPAPRRLHRSIHLTRPRTIHGSQPLTGSRIRHSKRPGRSHSRKRPTDVMPKCPPTPIQPAVHLASIFKRRPILHALKLLHNATCHFRSAFLIQPVYTASISSFVNGGPSKVMPHLANSASISF